MKRNKKYIVLTAWALVAASTTLCVPTVFVEKAQAAAKKIDSAPVIVAADSDNKFANVLENDISILAVSPYNLQKLEASGTVEKLFTERLSYNERMAEIISRWNELKPVFPSEVTPYEIAPSISAPYAAGKLKDSYLKDALNAINFVRFVAGLPDDVETTLEHNEKGQHGAVLMAASDFSHTPPKPADMPESFYQIGFANTSSSNIGFGYNSLSDAVYYGWMKDEDEHNIDRLGHRRWVLNPPMKYTGFGQATKDYNYLSMYSFDSSRAEEVDYETVLWPSGPAFPKEMFSYEDPWSVTLNPKKYQAPSLNEVIVTLTNQDTGEAWNFANSVSDGYFNVNNQNFGVNNCIIFRPTGISDYSGTYTVELNGIKYSNGSDAKISYDVTFFSLDAVYYSITSTAGEGGTVSGSGVYNEGDTVTLTAIPNLNYAFDGWYENNTKIPDAGKTYTFTATKNRNLQARFIYSKYEVIISNSLYNEATNTISIDLDVSNDTTTTNENTIIVAAYSKDGNLLGASKKLLPLNINESKSINTNIYIGSLPPDGYVLRAFAWNNINDMQPLTAPFVHML